MNRIFPTLIVNKKTFSNADGVSIKQQIDALINKKESLLYEINHNYEVYQSQLNELRSQNCRLRPKVCENISNRAEEYRLKWQSAKSTNEPIIASINQQIIELSKRLESETKGIEAYNALSPEQKQALEDAKAEQKRKKIKTILLYTSIIIGLIIGGIIIYKIRKRKAVKA